MSLRTRTWTGAIGAAVAMIAGVLIPAAVPSASAKVDPTLFDPSYIISDDYFYNGTAMSVDQIESLMISLEPTCATGSVCLKDYQQTTYDRPADGTCNGYSGAPLEYAAVIIAKVAVSCNVSPRVILVTLEKEQGLVSSSHPTDLTYRKAMGYGCPDTSVCDSKYYGFYNQVYSAGWQFQWYTNPAATQRRLHPLNTVWNIQYSPNTSCGTAPILLRNQATASLYYYTPYTPNAAALANPYGSGDTCSSYGNRNFWRIFTDWFGLPNPPMGADKFVKSVYADVLGREPDPEGLRTWVTTVNTTGKRSIVSDAVLSSVEYRQNRIIQAYQEILSRTPDPTGMALWLGLTGNGTLRIDEVTLVFMESDEYYTVLGGTNAAFVTAVYQRYLGRVPGADEITFWDPLIAQYGRSSVTRAIYGSIESAQGRIGGLYQKFLGRSTDPSGLATWTPVIIQNGDNALRSAIVSSDEYWQRSQVRF